MNTYSIFMTIPVALVALTTLGCDASDAFESEQVTRTTQQALVQSADDVLLARRAHDDARIVGVVEPVREGTDPYRVLKLHEVTSLPTLEGTRALDAQWIDKESAVVLGADQVLRHHTREGVQEIDREVLGPISISGDRLAYVHGEPPDLHLRLVTLGDEQIREVQEVAPAWSPALSEDGRSVIFVASYSGRPHFFLRREDGELEALPTGQRTPSSATAPIWRDGGLFFEDERGVVHLDLETSSIQEQFDGAKLMPYDGSDHIEIMEEKGNMRVISTWKQGGAR